jgi:hypothetical protein
MHKIMMAVIAAAVAGLAVPSAADAAVVCKDAKGKFIKCPPPAVVKTTVVTKSPMAPRTVVVTKTVSAGLTKDKNGRCHYASGPKRGQFAKCG